MSDAFFVHYLICPTCKRQLRVGATYFGIVRGVRCCSTVWINEGVALGALTLTPPRDENSAAGMCE